MHTKIRAEERDQVKYEKEVQKQQEAIEKERVKQERHRLKLAAIAEKGENRVFPYGLNYSENNHHVNNEDSSQAENHIVYKKIDSKALNSIITSKSVKEDYLLPSGPKKKKVIKNTEVERLFQNKSSSKDTAMFKTMDRRLEKEAEVKKEKVDTKKNKVISKGKCIFIIEF